MRVIFIIFSNPSVIKQNKRFISLLWVSPCCMYRKGWAWLSDHLLSGVGRFSEPSGCATFLFFFSFGCVLMRVYFIVKNSRPGSRKTCPVLFVVVFVISFVWLFFVYVVFVVLSVQEYFVFVNCPNSTPQRFNGPFIVTVSSSFAGQHPVWNA